MGEQQLVNALNPEDLTNCTSPPDLENNEVVAAVNCQAVEQGPTDRPLVVQFSDIDSAQAWFSNNTAGYFDRGDCAAGYKLGTWSYKYVVAGPLAALIQKAAASGWYGSLTTPSSVSSSTALMVQPCTPGGRTRPMSSLVTADPAIDLPFGRP